MQSVTFPFIAAITLSLLVILSYLLVVFFIDDDIIIQMRKQKCEITWHFYTTKIGDSNKYLGNIVWRDIVWYTWFYILTPKEAAMKALKKLSFRTQVFLSLILLMILPSSVLYMIIGGNIAKSATREYYKTLETIMYQVNSNLTSILTNTTKIGDLHILNDNVRKILRTDYQTDYLKYSQDNSFMQDQFVQANRFDTNLVSCMFQSKYDYTFTYNILTAAGEKAAIENIEKYEQRARSAPYHTYFAPISQGHSNIISQRNVIPMVKILLDGYNYQEIGICYIEINFDAIEKIIDSAQTENNNIMIFDTDDNITYSSRNLAPSIRENDTFIETIDDFTRHLKDSKKIASQSLAIDGSPYLLNGMYNNLTGFTIIQLIDEDMVSAYSSQDFSGYFVTLVIILALGFMISIYLSHRLTSAIRKIYTEINRRNSADLSSLIIDDTLASIEIQKLVLSFNDLYERLTNSLKQNYDIKLNEQQMYIQMLQSQINHHFLYNTLNTIKSIAYIHGDKEIETIAISMSDLLHYNLKKNPVVTMAEEIQQVQNYLTIQNVRFQNKYIFECSIPTEFLELTIPAFILQPLVENAIDHGFKNKEGNCYISLSAQMTDGVLHLFLADNGSGMSEVALERIRATIASGNNGVGGGEDHHAIGILNVHLRIQGFYGKQYGLAIDSIPESGTVIDICIPYEDAEVRAR